MNPTKAVHDYTPLVQKLVRKHLRRNPRLASFKEDFIQEGFLGLLDAVKRFDPTKGAFTTYAYFWIDQRLRLAVLEWFGSTTGRHNAGSHIAATWRKESPVLDNEGFSTTSSLVSYAARPDHLVEMQDLADKLRRKLSRMSPRNKNRQRDIDIFIHRAALERKYGDQTYAVGASKTDNDGSYSVLAKKYGISRERARQAAGEIAEKVRRWGAEIAAEAA